MLGSIGQLWLTKSGKLSKDWTADERNEASIMFAGFSNVIDENYSDEWVPPLKDVLNKAIIDKYLALCKLKGVDPYGDSDKTTNKAPAYTTGVQGTNANLSNMWDNYRGKCLGCLKPVPPTVAKPLWESRQKMQ